MAEDRVEHVLDERQPHLTLDLGEVSRVRVRVVGGEVSVGSASGQARLEAEWQRGPELVVVVDGGVLHIDHPVESAAFLVGGPRPAECALALTVPPGTPIELITVSAPVLVAGLGGDVAVRTVSGEIDATYLSGTASLATVSGPVAIEGISGELRVNTVSGDITAAAACVSRMAARSVSGSVIVDLNVKPEGSYAVTTVSGSVALRVPDDASLNVTASTLSGSLTSALRLEDERRSKRRMSGRTGVGDAEVKVSTLSGPFALLARAGVPA